MPTKTGNNKSAWTAKDIYDMIFSTYGNAHVNANKARAKEASKYMIPYIPEKEIMLTTGKYNTGKISTNLLDSIYNASQRTGVPLDIALGLAGRESTLGIGRGFKKGKSVSGTDLYSNWQQIQTIPNNKAQMKKWNSLLGRTDLTDEDYDFKSDFLIRAQDSLENTKPLDENPIDNALKFYQTGKYNPGDSRHTQMVEDDAKVLMSDPAIQKWLKTKTETQMKCGGRRKAQLGLDIREGGIAIPIANNMWYIHGRKHEYGGVTMGPNNKNGVEVEGGEVVEMIDSNHPSVGRQFAAGGQSQTMRVFSSVPLLRGVSPAQLVMGGANPDTVFKAQEEFKDRNRINDDGTTYEVGGEKIYTPSKSIRRQIQETGRITIGGAPTIGGLRTAKYVKGLATAKGYAKQANKIFTKVDNFVNNSLQGLINKHKITPNQADAYKKFYNEIVGVNGVNIPKTASFFLNNESKEMKAGGIYIKPSKRGTFTAAATKHGMGVQEFANKVLANKEDYSPAMVKKANFARNASRWKKEYGGDDTKTAVLKRLRNKFAIRGNYNGGMFGGAGAGSVIMAQPEYVTDTITKRYLVPVTQTFNDAFRDARNSGQNEFMFDGKLYNTNLGNNPNNNTAGSNRTSTIIVPIEHKEVRRRKKEFGGNMIYTINGNVKNGLMSTRPKAQYGTITRHGKIWKWDEENGAYVPVKDSKEKEPINVNKQTKSSVSSNKKSNYTVNGTFDNARPQFYAEKRLPIAGSQSIAEKVGLARSGWSYGENPTFDYVPNINISVPTNYAKAVGDNSKKSTSSTARGEGTKASTSKATSQSTPTIQDTVNKITADAWKASKTPKIDLSKAKMPIYNVSDLGSKESRAAKAKLNTSSTGGGTQSKEAPWIPQYNTITGRDWLGVGTNLAGHIASYFANNSLLKKAPMPTKPVQFQAAKLKTTHNINPDLANIDEVSQMNLAEVGRNTASSNTSIARKQRIMNEARDAKNKLYGQKENIETQLINLDRRNRQDVYNRNIAAYNDWLDKTYVAKSNNLVEKQRNLTNLISGIPMAVNTMLGTIENRKSTNDMIRAIAAANPNVDGRLLGIGDYYTQKQSNGRTAVYNKNHKLVKYV